MTKIAKPRGPLKALRGRKTDETRVSSPKQRVSRRERLSAPERTQVDPAKIAEVLATAIPPAGTVDVMAVIVHEPGGKLPDGSPSGLGSRARYGAGWFDGLEKSEPIGELLFDTPREAYDFINSLAGPEGELWRRKEQRRAKIAELDAAEAAMEVDAIADHKEQKRLKKLGVDLKEATGGGSRRPLRSSAKPSASTPEKMSRRERLRQA